MLFSECFNVTRTTEDDWFDPYLSIDTPLFIDPFLIYVNEFGFFEGSHNEIIKVFEDIFIMISKSGGLEKSVNYQKALRALIFPEVQEICLGYTQAGTKGSGSGNEFSAIMAYALWEAVNAGLKNITHFEEVALFNKGIGADRISDAVANILRKRLIAYTQEVCHRHQIPMESKGFAHGFFSHEYMKWIPLQDTVPINPLTNRPVILVPAKYLRHLPTINPEDFWDYCFSNENETIRREFGEDVTKNVSKENIVDFAKHHPDLRQDYIQNVENIGSEPYDLTIDRKGFVNWYPATQDFAARHPVSVSIDNEEIFLDTIEKMLMEYKHFIERNGGWYLLWNESNQAKPEKASQLVCLGIIKHYCKANNIDISREAEVGIGPVDFKASRGFNLRVHIEIKKANNSKFWNGLEKQLPAYMLSDQVKKGFFVVIWLYDNDEEKIIEINERIKTINKTTGKIIKKIIIDARPKQSASKL